MFSLEQEKPNDTLLPLYIFLNAMHLNLKAKGQFDMNNWLSLYIILFYYKNIFKILVKKQSTQSTNEKYDEKLTSTQDLVGYGRNPSCSCYKPLTENNRRFNCVWVK